MESFCGNFLQTDFIAKPGVQLEPRATYIHEHCVFSLSKMFSLELHPLKSLKLEEIISPKAQRPNKHVYLPCILFLHSFHFMSDGSLLTAVGK